MVEHYLNVLTVRLRGYDGQPLPENLVDEIAVEVLVGGRVDIEQLASELRKVVGGGPRRIQQTITETSWGASGSGGQLIVDVPIVVTGLASLPILWDTIIQRILRRGKTRILDSQSQAQLARAWLAEDLSIGSDAINVTDLEPLGDGYRVRLETSAGTFDVEVDSSGVTRMHRR